MDYADVREGLYDHLCMYITEVQDSSSPPKCKVFWEWTAPADIQKPYIEIAFMGELAPVNGCAVWMQLEVLVFGEESNILAIDPIADHVVSSLHNQDVITPDGRTIRPKYVRDSRMDFWVETPRANGIRLKFLIPSDFWTVP